MQGPNSHGPRQFSPLVRRINRDAHPLFSFKSHRSSGGNVIVPRQPRPPDTLKFKDDGTFKIMQITDLHVGEDQHTWWGRFQDLLTKSTQNFLLDRELPDLAIFSGDLITAHSINNTERVTHYWAKALKPVIDRGIPFASTFGNHDADDGALNTRHRLMEFDMKQSGSWTREGPRDIEGLTNYVLPIYDSSGEKVQVLLYVMDSGDSNDDRISKAQVKWVKSTAKEWKDKMGRHLPSLAFFHIALPEYKKIWACDKTYGLKDDVINTVRDNNGLLDLFRTINTQGVFVGHDHGIDFCGDEKGVLLCYGRHTGYGGYGGWMRGTRMVQFRGEEWKTWVTTERGQVIPLDRAEEHIPSRSDCEEWREAEERKGSK
ncbi:metallophosphoesterase [Planoprotostelium fungivorum]|uniref:Metallophosphoesterase n=1 Tax=Planoprotostelium fungivorum TaxID=1890364 RepID=A0A2P6NK93_9EUKA|nr:metallophosphoesterase [Planoprotostelium fungivorum]